MFIFWSLTLEKSLYAWLHAVLDAPHMSIQVFIFLIPEDTNSPHKTEKIVMGTRENKTEINTIYLWNKQKENHMYNNKTFKRMPKEALVYHCFFLCVCSLRAH